MNKAAAKTRLVAVVRALAAEKRADLERHKEGQAGLARPDFIWHYLLQSFSTMGRASGWHGLIGNKDNYHRVTYAALAALTPEARAAQIRQVCRAAAIRMPDKKADFILGCFEYVTRLGGPESAKAKLLALPGREAKIAFLQSFPGIGPKYARNIMMDVYHEDFRDSIALDVRIKAISESLDLSFKSYRQHEAFYLDVARAAGLNGWELDRLLFNFRPEVESRLGVSLEAAMPQTDRVMEILCQTKLLAREYRQLTGKPLGVTGEVAEYEAARILNLQLSLARQAGYDAIETANGLKRRLQVKGRCILEGSKRSQMVPSINLRHEFDAVLLVLLDDNFEAFAIYEAERAAIMAALTAPGSVARNERGAMAVSKFKAIGKVRWLRPA